MDLNFGLPSPSQVVDRRDPEDNLLVWDNLQPNSAFPNKNDDSNGQKPDSMGRQSNDIDSSDLPDEGLEKDIDDRGVVWPNPGVTECCDVNPERVEEMEDAQTEVFSHQSVLRYGSGEADSTHESDLKSAENMDSNHETAKNVDPTKASANNIQTEEDAVGANQEAVESRPDSAEPHQQVVSSLPNHQSPIRNSIDEAIESVVAYYAHWGERVGSDSESQGHRSGAVVGGVTKNRNRFIRIVSQKRKNPTMIGCTSLLKASPASSASSATKIQNSGTATSIAPFSMLRYIRVQVPEARPIARYRRLLPKLPEITSTPELPVQNNVVIGGTTNKSPSDVADPVARTKLDNSPNVTYLVKPGKPPQGAHMVKSPSDGGLGNIVKGELPVQNNMVIGETTNKLQIEVADPVTSTKLDNSPNVTYLVKPLPERRFGKPPQGAHMVKSPPDGSLGNVVKDCLVKQLREQRFMSHEWTEDKRRKILNRGRQCPNFEIAHDKDLKHRTSEYYYKTIPWLTGSSVLSKWFCWPCLLYAPRHTWSWDPRTFNRAKFTSDTEIHENSSEHLEASFQMKIHQMNIKKSSNFVPVQNHNESVRKNRHFLKLLAEVVCTVKKKLNNMYTSHIDCVELINLISCYDSDIKRYLTEKSQSSKNPADLVSLYVGGIMASIETLIRSKIKPELDAAPFVCLILEDASDVVDKSWIAVIVRYVNKDGAICERFVRFVEFGNNREPTAVIPVLKDVVTKLDIGNKLVGFTYGGTLIEPPRTVVFNKMISLEYPPARFFHYKEHNLFKLICQSLSHFAYTKSFFQCISDLSDFFECMPNAVATFISTDQDMNYDGAPPKKLDFSSEFILTIKNYYASILKLLMRIIAWPNDWTSEATVQAPYFLNFLRGMQTRFFIVLLSKIFLAVDALAKGMEGNIDVDDWKLLVKRATFNLLNLKNHGFDETVKLACSNTLTKDVSVVSTPDPNGPTHEDMFNEMIDYAATVVNCRLEGAAMSLISLETFKSVGDGDGRQQTLVHLLDYLKIVDISKVNSQIHFFLNHKFFTNRSASQAIQCIKKFQLSDTLPDLLKVLQLSITLPNISSDTYLNPKVKRVKAYVKGKVELNSTDALMWIEKDFIDQLQEDCQFYENVIDIFVRQYGVSD